MSTAFYNLCKLGCKFVKLQCVREVVLAPERANRSGGFILACTHLSHLEPIVVSCVVRRHVRWMARIEFYRARWGASVLNWGGAFPVDRFGYSLPAVRNAIRLAARGEVVGIFPEGEVSKGDRSVLRGAAIKRGVCAVAIHAKVPVVPVVVLGTDKLNRVAPWLPFKRARVWIAFGNDIVPDPTLHRRAARFEMADRLRAEYVRTYRELIEAAGLRDDQIP